MLCLEPLKLYKRGFESHSVHRCIFVLFYVEKGLVMSWFTIQEVLSNIWKIFKFILSWDLPESLVCCWRLKGSVWLPISFSCIWQLCTCIRTAVFLSHCIKHVMCSKIHIIYTLLHSSCACAGMSKFMYAVPQLDTQCEEVIFRNIQYCSTAFT
jgi:hypothetical protein